MLGHVGHLGPEARHQFNSAVQHVKAVTFNDTLGDACKAALEASAASLLPHATMCDLVLNLCAPKTFLWTLS